MTKLPPCQFKLARLDGDRWVEVKNHYWRGFVGFVLLALAGIIGLAWVIGGVLT